MTKLDEDGKYWSAEVDVAYKNAKMSIENADIGISTPVLDVPEKDGVIYNIENDWTIYGMDEDIDEIGDELGGYDEDTVTADHKDALLDIIADVEAKLADDEYLTDAQREALNAIKTKAQALIAAADGTPDTGDYSDMMLWMAVMAVGAAALIGAKNYRNICRGV